jgi:uncharacterized protein
MRSGLSAMGMLVALAASAIVIIMLVRVPNIYAVQGNGEVRYTPDEADISVGYYTEADASADAAKQAAAAMREILAALRAVGVKDSAIASTAVRSDMVTDENRANTPTAQRKPLYYASQSVSVDVKDLGQIGKILDGISKAGSNFWLVRYKLSHKKDAELRDAVHSMALANAIARADAHARDGRFKRGRILKIQDGDTSFPDVNYQDRDYDMGQRRRSYDAGYRPESIVVTGTRVREVDTTFDIPPPKEVSVTTTIDVLFEMD